MIKHSLTTQGYNYILNPPRNKKGCIRVAYFRKVILIYMLSVKDTYIPDEFKKYIQSLNILKDNDKIFMNTRDYPVWKHYVDRAKQQLLDNKYIYETDKKFRLSSTKISQVYNEISDYIKEK